MAMDLQPQMPAPALVADGPAAEPCPAVLAAKALAKILKKQRKHDRMRNFLAWCSGCRSFGGSF